MPRIGCICHGGNGDSPRAHLPWCGPRAARSVQAEALAGQEPGELLALRRSILPGLVLRPAVERGDAVLRGHPLARGGDADTGVAAAVVVVDLLEPQGALVSVGVPGYSRSEARSLVKQCVRTRRCRGSQYH